MLASTRFSTLASNAGRPQVAKAQTVTTPHRRAFSLRPCAGGNSSNGATPLPSATVPVTDEAVPEAHRGLHASLYGDGDATDAHGTASASSAYAFREGEDDGSTLIPVNAYLDAREGERPVGVYAVYDARRNLQYVSYSRNVVLAVRTVRSRVGEERCAFVKVMVFANKAMQTRAALEREVDNWLEEAGTVPPGNGADRESWEGSSTDATGSSFDTSSMTPDELAEYEEKKIKMQRAMGDKTVQLPEATGDERRERLRAAIEGDDWSEVIDGQTAATTTAAAGGSAQVVTPFARASVHRSVGNNDGEADAAYEEMTVDSVDKALDEVRPYLMADGGNVDVVSVEDGIVALELQGACGTCPSSSATMKMGIERTLKAKFGEQLKEVMSVGGPAGHPTATVEGVDMHLNMLRGAVAAYGGGVEVLSVEAGVATLKYSGPKPIGYGIVAAVKDKFPDLRDVAMMDAESGDRIKF